MVSISNTTQYKCQKRKKSTLNSWLQTYLILTNNVQMLILCLSYSITTVLIQLELTFPKWFFCFDLWVFDCKQFYFFLSLSLLSIHLCLLRYIAVLGIYNSQVFMKNGFSSFFRSNYEIIQILKINRNWSVSDSDKS